jgi:DNA-binding response OmpR family regulator
MLPKKDGFTLAADIRAIDQEVPIIFLTAKNMKEDKLHGFRLGADDYITKPFSMEELVLRIEVFLKRSGKERTTTIGEQIFKINSYQFDYPNLELEGPGETKRLTQREADVLRMLCMEQEKVVKKEDMLRKIWGSNDYFAGRSLDVFISKLRKYLSEDDSVEISNYHGVGFKLVVKK